MSDRILRWTDTVANAPDSWRRGSLGELFTQRVEQNRSDLPLLSVTASNGVVPRDSLSRRDTSNEDKSKYLRVVPGDIVYNTMRMWQGVSARTNLEGIVSPAYTVCVPRAGLDSEFAAYLLRYPALVNVFRAHSQGLVDDTLSLKYEAFARIKVAVPTRGEQERIISVLKSAGEAIHTAKAVLKQIDKVRKGLLQDLLTRGIGHTRFRRTAIGEIPEGWGIARLHQIADIFNGKVGGTGGSRVRAFKTKHVYDGPVRLSQPEFVPDDRIQDISERTYLKDGDVLTPNMAHGTIGRIAYVPHAGSKWTVDGQVTVIRSRNSEYFVPRFLYDFLASSPGRRQILEREVGSIFGDLRGQTHLYVQDLASVNVPVPTLKEQKEIASVLQAVDDAAADAERVAEQHQCVLSGLLQDLLTGQVRVPTAVCRL